MGILQLICENMFENIYIPINILYVFQLSDDGDLHDPFPIVAHEICQVV